MVIHSSISKSNYWIVDSVSNVLKLVKKYLENSNCYKNVYCEYWKYLTALI